MSSVLNHIRQGICTIMHRNYSQTRLVEISKYMLSKLLSHKQILPIVRCKKSCFQRNPTLHVKRVIRVSVKLFFIYIVSKSFAFCLESIFFIIISYLLFDKMCTKCTYLTTISIPMERFLNQMCRYRACSRVRNIPDYTKVQNNKRCQGPIVPTRMVLRKQTP